MQKQTFTRGEEIKRVIPMAGGRQLPLSRPLIMGILNVTPDSFSDGGKYATVKAAVGHALGMVDEGADIIDIGGESTRPGSDPVNENEEQQRILPVVERLRAESAVTISIDTYRASTARLGIDAGANIVNDISALRFDTEMATLVAEQKAPVVLMHMLGKPKEMQNNPHYDDCVLEIDSFFTERLEFCRQSGIDKSKIILDPGIGFGKRLSDNLEILARLGELTRFGLPLMTGASRKSFIGILNPTEDKADERLGGSIAAAVIAVANGADIVRVHDVVQTVSALKLLQAVKEVQ
jgi:dihydropteroate synthase